jgi:hypothetical protein
MCFSSLFLRLVPVRELERWLDSNAARMLEGES